MAAHWQAAITITMIKMFIIITNVITCILARIASNGVVSTVAEAPPSGAAMHCRQSRGIQIGDTPLNISVTARRYIHLFVYFYVFISQYSVQLKITMH